MSTTPVAGDLQGCLSALRHRIDGDVLVPADPGFATACDGWNRGVTHHPGVVVVAADVGDVIATVAFARDAGLGLGVQATGHGPAQPVDGVLLVTSRMGELDIDAEARTAWVGAGCAWAPVLEAAARHGLAPLVGSSTAVGAVGFTIGGGLGWLARRYGPACDAVRSFEVVTPDGTLVQASRDEHPALFRALRGGGGGALGVITEMEIELFPVTTVYAGNLRYPADAAPAVVAAWSAWVATAPDELTSSVVLVAHPGRPSAVVVRGCWSGDVDDGRRLLDQWRATMPPAADSWLAMPFADIAAISDHPRDPQPTATGGGWLVDPPLDAGLPPEVGVALATATFGADPTWRCTAEIRHAGGAVAAGPAAGGSSMGNRDHRFHLQLTAAPPTARDLDAADDAIAGTVATLGDHLSGRTYLNALTGPARRAGAATSLDAPDRDAIRAVCAELDPTDLLRYGIDHRPR